MDNSLTLKKNQNFSSSYLPYEVEINSKEFEGKPIIMLSSKEKINELKSIISEQENKIHFLDLVSQKFINLIKQDGNIDLDKLRTQIQNNKELYQKINSLEKENQKLKLELNEQKNYIDNLNINKNSTQKINNEDNKNNNININNNINMYRHNSVKGISFTPYIHKNTNLNFNYNENYNSNNIINNNNKNYIDYLSEKNKANINNNSNNLIYNNEQRLKNKKYINKFINSNFNNDD